MSSQDLKTPLLIASRDNGPSPNQNAESEPMSPIIKITQTTASGQSPFWASDKSWEDRKAEAQKYLTDNKDDPKLKLHLLAHELNYEEIEKLAQQEWKKIGYHLDKQHKYMIKDNEKWPIIRMNPSEGLFVFNMGPLGLAFGKIEQDKSISIGKPLNQLKLYIKQNELGLTPLIYAIWAEQDAKTLLKRTSGLFYYMEFEIDDLGHFINLNEVIQNELYQAYLHFDSIEAIKFIIKSDFSNMLKLIIQEQRFKIVLPVNKSHLLLSLKYKSLECFSLIIEEFSKDIFKEIKKTEESQNIRVLSPNSVVEDAINGEVGSNDELSKYLKEIDEVLKFYLEFFLEKLKNQELNIDSSSITIKEILNTVSSRISINEILKNDYSNILNWIIQSGKYNINSRIFNQSLLLIAIKSNSIRCTDIILDYLIQTIKNHNKNTMKLRKLIFINIEKELGDYLLTPSSHIKELLSLVIEEKYKRLQENSEDLPKCRMIEDKTESENIFKNNPGEEENTNVKIINTSIRIPGTMGSEKSINFLKNLEASKNLQLHKAPIIKYYLRYKWDYVRPIVLFLDILILSNIPILYILIYILKAEDRRELIEKHIYLVLILLLNNFILSLYEIFQIIALGFHDYFGLIDFNAVHFFVTLRFIFLIVSVFINFFSSEVLFLGSEMFTLFSYVFCSIIFIFNSDFRRWYETVTLIRVTLIFAPLLIFWYSLSESQTELFISSISAFIYMTVIGGISINNFYEWRPTISGIKLVIVFIALLIGSYKFEIFIIFELIFIGLLTSNLFIIKEYNLLTLGYLIIDSIIAVSFSLNFLLENFYFLNLFVFILCFFTFAVDAHKSSIDNHKYFIGELGIYLCVLFLIVINPNKNKIQIVFVIILSCFQLIFLNFKQKFFFNKIILNLKNLLFNWNTFDLLRLALFYFWFSSNRYTDKYLYLTYALVSFTFIRGLTAFRSFNGTRLYIRLIFNSMKDISSFLIIFFYSTFCFGIIMGIYKTDYTFETMGKVWINAYFLNFGEFKDEYESLDINYITFIPATILNVIIMLNLLISILGDSFDKFQVSASEIDSMEMTSVIIEIENLLFWRRKINDKGMFLVVCDSESRLQHNWEGKILIIKRMLEDINNKITENHLEIRNRITENQLDINEKINKKFIGISNRITDINQKMMEQNKSQMENAIQIIEGYFKKDLNN